jgi:lysophospholipase L1-like esterase
MTAGALLHQVIMLGTNDCRADDPMPFVAGGVGDRHVCAPPARRLPKGAGGEGTGRVSAQEAALADARWLAQHCPFVKHYIELISAIRERSPARRSPPAIHLVIPPPLLWEEACDVQQLLLHRVLPTLIRAVSLIAGLRPPISAFEALGGEAAERKPFACSRLSREAEPHCELVTCDRTHPNAQGYEAIARAVAARVLARRSGP